MELKANTTLECNETSLLLENIIANLPNMSNFVSLNSQTNELMESHYSGFGQPGVIAFYVSMTFVMVIGGIVSSVLMRVAYDGARYDILIYNVCSWINVYTLVFHIAYITTICVRYDSKAQHLYYLK